jgi:hypothetical protein
VAERVRYRLQPVQQHVSLVPKAQQPVTDGHREGRLHRWMLPQRAVGDDTAQTGMGSQYAARRAIAYQPGVIR